MTGMLQNFQKSFDDLGVEERIDIYLLPRNNQGLLPKIRGGESFEIKRRLNISESFERWEVAVQKDFPLSAKTVAHILHILDEHRLEVVRLPDSRAAVEFFGPCLDTLCVPKMRRLFKSNGCRAEITHVLISLKPYETVAFESEDPNEIAGNLEKFHLKECDNKNYGAMLREIAVPS
ncbi:hypothetical protein [Hyphococcus sp.]|uniref:hypothetical protein n=2 Tax=Hyphococcus sp. TaxID=2038636 RepID=UPI0035C6FF96